MYRYTGGTDLEVAAMEPRSYAQSAYFLYNSAHTC